MKKYYVTRDYKGNKYRIELPEDRLMPWEKGGAWDLIPFIALIVTIAAGFIIF